MSRIRIEQAGLALNVLGEAVVESFRHTVDSLSGESSDVIDISGLKYPSGHPDVLRLKMDEEGRGGACLVEYKGASLSDPSSLHIKRLGDGLNSPSEIDPAQFEFRSLHRPTVVQPNLA